MPRFAFSVLAVCALSGWVALAQYGRGTILGTVTDSSGAAIPGVRVSARSLETNETREFMTDDYRSPLF